MTGHDDLFAEPRMTRAEAIRDLRGDSALGPEGVRCARGRLINATTGRCGYGLCRACASLRDGDPVRCPCGWDDGGDLVIHDTPIGLLVSGDEGRPRGFCPECDEPLNALSVEVVA